MSDEHEVLEIERHRIDGTVKRDVAALERVYADDLTYTHSSARQDTKASLIESIRSGQTTYHAIDVEERQVRVWDGAAVVTGASRMHVSSRGQESRFRIRFTLVYAKRPAGWQAVAWQSTRLPD